MLRYIIKRIVLIPITLLIVSMLLFFLINLNSVDPATTLLPSTATQEDRDALHVKLGLDKPLIIQYGSYIKNALSGNLGDSWYTKGPVWDEIKSKIPVTTKLALYSTVITVLIGLPLGVLCAVKQYTLTDGLLNAISKLIGSMPNFWMALMLMLLFSVKLKILPIYGFSTWKHWILPVATISVQTIGTYLRIVRSSMLDCVRQDYIRTARAKGNKERAVIFKHALKNALLPVVTSTGQLFATLMGGALVVETVFSIPGLGTCVIHAVKIKDIPLVMGSVLFISLIFLVTTLVIDMLYVLIDPRVKANFASVRRTNESDLVEFEENANEGGSIRI